METGKVKFFNEKKGFGFIVADTGAELFFHFSEIQQNGFKTLKTDDVVSFDVESDERGQKAKNIKLV